jgi:hypothetical protein
MVVSSPFLYRFTTPGPKKNPVLENQQKQTTKAKYNVVERGCQEDGTDLMILFSGSDR